MSASIITVYYNGSCNICAPEIAMYQRRTQALEQSRVSYIDVSSAAVQELAPGKTRADMLKRLHIQKNGIWYSGVDAFTHLWHEVPGFRWLARLVGFAPVRLVANPIYDRVLAPWLYHRHLRKTACETS